MRVLVVDEEIPYPLNTGKRLRTYNLLKHLATRHKIVFVCRQHENEQGSHAEALKKIGIKPVVVPHTIRKKAGLKFYLALIANLFSRLPYSVSSHYSLPFEDKIKQLLSSKRFDIIHCEWTPYAVNLGSVLPFPSVVDAHNVEAQIWKRNYEVEKNPLVKAFIYLQWKKMARFEENAFPKFTKIISVSKEDQAVISNWVDKAHIEVVQNGVDIEYFRSSGKTEKPFSMVFTGSMDWRPNVDGILYFLSDIWPGIKATFPESRVIIVGRNPMQVLKDRIKKETSVTLTGTVDDVRPFVEEALVYIVPLRVGGGSRLKILEALSMKKAVVSTSVGAEGLELQSGKDLIIADSPHDFKEAVTRLFKDEKLRKDLGKAGKTVVEEKYQWKAISKRLEKIWIKAAGQEM